MSDNKMKRRTFLKQSAVIGAGLVVGQSGILRAGNSPNEKLNIAVIGVGGRGGGNMNSVSGENIVALCDVNGKNLASAAKRFENAKTYVDWRKCLEQKNIDAVVCSTTDHTHAFVNVWAMNRGMHVYCEKPIANSVEEAQMVRAAYMRSKNKIATQMGTQIHASDNYRRMVELIRGGAIGTPKEVRVWCSRTPAGGSYLPEVKPIPDHINWDLWVGPAPFHPYNPGYIGGCLKWNRFWDFGSGQIGDIRRHYPGHGTHFPGFQSGLDLPRGAQIADVQTMGEPFDRVDGAGSGNVLAALAEGGENRCIMSMSPGSSTRMNAS